MRKNEKDNIQLREEAVQILYDSLKLKHDITKEECYEIYDKMQRETSSSDKTNNSEVD